MQGVLIVLVCFASSLSSAVIILDRTTKEWHKALYALIVPVIAVVVVLLDMLHTYLTS